MGFAPNRPALRGADDPYRRTPVGVLFMRGDGRGAMGEEKFIGYFRVVEACLEPGCPVCRCVTAESRSYLDALLYEQVTDADTRRAIRASWGFCNWHTWMLVEIEHSLFGAAIIYEDLVTLALRRTERLSHRAARDLAYLGSLPLTGVLRDGGQKIFSVHRSPHEHLYRYTLTPDAPDEHLRAEIAGVDDDVILLGHTHFPGQRGPAAGRRPTCELRGHRARRPRAPSRGLRRRADGARPSRSADSPGDRRPADLDPEEREGVRPRVQGSDRLRTLARLADEAGARALAAAADALAERLREGRFYVVCVGQFKRGKSTLLNALVGETVLPTGVVPITAAVTVVRYGERLAARVRFGERDWEECEPRALATYVPEEQNPGNEKGVTGVEVFVPSALLASGMCLVDTPGIGSVSEANIAATRAFVPHIDAALVVLGVDPPISGEEMALVQDVARQIRDLGFVLNKADRQSDTERREAIGFTERVLAERLGRSVGPIRQVSAAERIARSGPRRDWHGLVETLQSLAKESGAHLVRSAERRGVTMLIERLMRELDEQRAALVRPIEESEARVEALRSAAAEAERSMVDLRYLLPRSRSGSAAGSRTSAIGSSTPRCPKPSANWSRRSAQNPRRRSCASARSTSRSR